MTKKLFPNIEGTEELRNDIFKLCKIIVFNNMKVIYNQEKVISILQKYGFDLTEECFYKILERENYENYENYENN